jgi:hypothetical protein
MKNIKTIEIFDLFGCYIDLDPYEPLTNCITLLKKIRHQFPVMYNDALAQIKLLDMIGDDWWDKELEIANTIDTIKTKGTENDNTKFELHILMLSYFNLVISITSDNVMFVGRPWCTIEDDETGSEFKLSTQEVILSLFNEECINYKGELL